MPKRILVTGAGGQVGSELRRLSNAFREHTFIFTDSQALDITDRRAVEVFCRSERVDVIINCAAYTAVDRAENDRQTADAVNHLAVKAMAQIAKDNAIALIHLSTDYVFDGESFKPYTEEDATNPQGVYAQTKCDGEKAMLAINPKNSVIVRTSWVYSAFGNNFVKTMLRLGRERDELGVVFDQVGSPTYARDIARAVLDLLGRLKNGGTQIYHYSNEGVCSWYDFAKAIFELSATGCRVNPIETKAYPTPAPRPHYSVLNKTKIKAAFGMDIPYWRDSLKECLDAMKEQE